jgi:hypothetical protein
MDRGGKPWTGLKWHRIGKIGGGYQDGKGQWGFFFVLAEVWKGEAIL